MSNQKKENTIGTYSDRVLDTLTSLGWEVNRSTSIEEHLTELSTNGFTINEVARRILRTFGGCCFQIPEGGIGWIHFTITEARHTFRSDYIPVLETLIEEEGLCPVGGGGGYILFACPSGKVALLQEQWFQLLVADSVSDLFEAILFNDRTHCREVVNVEACRPDW